MNIRRASVLAWAIWTVAVLSAAASLPLIIANRDADTGSLGGLVGAWPTKVLTALVFLSIPTVGAIAASRRPENAVGWLLLAAALPNTIDPFMGAYATYTLVTDPGALPGGTFIAWASETWGWTLQFVLLTAILVVFPGGRVPGRYPRALALVIAIPAALLTIGYALRPGPLDNFGFLANPYALDEAAGQLIGTFISSGFLLSFLGMLLAGANFLVRFRRARGVQRQQLKWLAYPAGLIAAYVPLAVVLGSIAPHEQLVMVPVTFVGLVIPVTIPLAAGLAVLRYRLYDVDLFINRTVVYGATTAAIAVMFFAGIVALQALLRPLTSGNELAIAASTLISFALFQPVRRRVQDAVDRRFDRSRYDAARTLDSFADRLRDEVDLDALRADLLGAVRDTMAPAHASLWLREHAR